MVMGFLIGERSSASSKNDASSSGISLRSMSSSRWAARVFSSVFNLLFNNQPVITNGLMPLYLLLYVHFGLRSFCAAKKPISFTNPGRINLFLTLTRFYFCLRLVENTYQNWYIYLKRKTIWMSGSGALEMGQNLFAIGFFHGPSVSERSSAAISRRSRWAGRWACHWPESWNLGSGKCEPNYRRAMHA